MKTLFKTTVIVLIVITIVGCNKNDDTQIIKEAQVSTFAGSTKGFANGMGTTAQFDFPHGLAIDTQGNIYVADTNNDKIRKISPEGVVSTLAGSSNGFADGVAGNAKFHTPYGVALDAQGNVYVADLGNAKIRKIDPNGTVSTLAGSTQGFADGAGASAQFNYPKDLAVDEQGNVYVADSNNNKIRKITPNGMVSTFAGSAHGFADGAGVAAQFGDPQGVEIDSRGDVYVADTDNSKIRKITPNGEVTTLAGSTAGFADGTGVAAQFSFPEGLATDSQGNVYVADTGNDKIRRITPNGEVSTSAGSTQGFADGTGTIAQFSNPFGVAIDVQGGVYVGDSSNDKIRKITQE